MLWKILTIIGFLALLGAGAFSWLNKNQLADARYLLQQNTSNKAFADNLNEKLSETKTKAATTLEELNRRLEAKKGEVATLTSELAAQEQSVTTAKNLLDEISQQLIALDDKVKLLGDIQKLLAEITQHQNDLETATNDVTVLKNNLASIQANNKSMEERIKDAYEREQEAKRGVVAGNFQAYVTRSFPQYGFVVINKGGNNGAFLNSVLDVRRGGAIVGSVKITHVEANSSTANVVAGTMAPGDTPQAGDLLIAGAEARRVAATAKQQTTGAPALGEAADPTAPPAPAEGQPAAPADGGMAPAPADPFSNSAPAADPFGAPADPSPAPAAPATGTGDPLADGPSAPAPATDPAAPAGATADPFSTSPAPGAAMQEKAN